MSFLNIQLFTFSFPVLVINAARMVRVMNIYHFSKQSIEQLKSDLVGGCMISSNELVLAKADHAIEIRTLNGDANEGQEEFKNFATVDDVEQIIYCQNGDYIATLESRICNYEQAEKRFVRVYTNFDLLKSNTDEDYTNTAMRARIAGKITPMHKCTLINIFELIIT